jgi:hypothetical protein
MQTKPSPVQQLKDHAILWLLNNPEHAIRIEKARKRVREWLR